MNYRFDSHEGPGDTPERKSIYKQTKNSKETGSNLSLGTRLTVLSKRLGRKRCCDATPNRFLGDVPSHYLRFALLKKMRRLVRKMEGFG